MLIILGILLFLCVIFVIKINGNVFLLEQTATFYVYLFGIRIFKLTFLIIENKIILKLGRFRYLTIRMNMQKKHYFKLNDMIEFESISILFFLGVENPFVYNVSIIVNNVIYEYLSKKIKISTLQIYPISYAEEGVLRISMKIHIAVIKVLYATIMSAIRKLKSLKEEYV